MSIFRPLPGPGDPNHYQVASINVICPHCQNQTFYESRVQCNIHEPTYSERGYIGKMATALICSRCSLMLYFTKKPEKTLG